MDPHHENDSEQATREYLEGFSFEVARFHPPNWQGGDRPKWPDQLVYQLRLPLFIVEVKDVQRIKSETGEGLYFKDAPNGGEELVWGSHLFTEDKDAISKHLEKASAQFQQVDKHPQYDPVPRVLWFHSRLPVPHDVFERAVKGVFRFPSFEDFDPSVRELPLQATLQPVDLIVWKAGMGLQPVIFISDRGSAKRRQVAVALAGQLHRLFYNDWVRQRIADRLPYGPGSNCEEVEPYILFGGKVNY